MDRVERLLQGSIDMHVHPGPSLMSRSGDSWEFAEQAAAAGMRGIVLKDHHIPTAAHAYLANHHLQNAGDFESFGAICLNNSVGGVNPFALDAAIKLGIKLVWFPTISERKHIELFTKANRRPEEFVPTRVPPMTEKPIVVLDENGELKEEVKTCIKMIADADIILATGHCDYDETYAITKYAIEVGVTKIVFTHLPMFTTMDKEALKKITDLGGIVEFTYMNQLEATPEAYRMTGAEMAEYIRFFGPDKCLCSTDFGISLVPTPVEGMRMVIRWLIEQGFTDDEITTMIRKNPAKLLGIQ